MTAKGICFARSSWLPTQPIAAYCSFYDQNQLIKYQFLPISTRIFWKIGILCKFDENEENQLFCILKNQLTRIKNIMQYTKRIYSTFSKARSQQILTTFNEIIAERRASRSQVAEKSKKDELYIPIKQYVEQHTVDLTLYMKHDHPPSLYAFYVLNYNQMGFKRVSDLALLDRASYFLNMRKIQQTERWPTMKVEIGIEEKKVLKGNNEIEDWLAKNNYISNKIQRGTAQIDALQNHIKQHIVPPLQALFWHPTLTFQYSFHTYFDNASRVSRNEVISLLGRNLSLVFSRIFTNLGNIFKHKQRYFTAKEKLTAELREVQKIYFKDGGFFGGSKPNHADFILLSEIQAKMGSYHFRKFLEEELKGDTRRWLLRMKQLCQYNEDRVTLL